MAITSIPGYSTVIMRCVSNVNNENLQLCSESEMDNQLETNTVEIR